MTLLTKAYAVYADQVFGPGWLISEKYVIDAIVPAGATKEQFERMLQNLSVQRFKLVLQREERDLSAYNLLGADGGPKLRLSPVAKVEVTGDDAQSAPEPHSRLELDSDGCPVARIAGHGAVGSVGTSNCTAFRRYTIPDLICR
jgi:uncharacterized protein (TIGR03435 family)